ncbi:GNAT family N-acetyltransferase [Streptomyces sp. NPDC127190]|uniref:GNAT family N-acetyltransferase n=1 Tax=unclassified Streptomyces TaxID=2593676 RepID=UPI00362B3BD2
MTIMYEWRGAFDNAAVDALHAEAFGHPSTPVDWHTRLHRHSLGWVCARAEGRLVGFVNVAWDGGAHAFLLDTMVAADLRRSGVGSGLVATAARSARAADCAWLHADYEAHLRPFYLEGCGFRPTEAGLLDLSATAAG